MSSYDTLDESGYTGLQKFAHWATVALLLVIYTLAWGREGVENPEIRGLLLGVHRSTGILLLALTALRMSMRFYLKPLPVPWTFSRIQGIAATLVHAGLYVTLLVQPLLGWALTSAKGRAVDLFGVVRLPALLAKDRELAERLGESHEILALAMLALIGLHIAAALLHAVVLKDGTFRRMTVAPAP